MIKCVNTYVQIADLDTDSRHEKTEESVHVRTADASKYTVVKCYLSRWWGQWL